MSTKCPTKYQLNQWINCCVGIHDLICDCHHPTKHLITHLFSKQEEYQVTPEEKKNIEKCLTTTEGNGTTTLTGDDDFDAGDLERIFAEDTTGENIDG